MLYILTRHETMLAAEASKDIHDALRNLPPFDPHEEVRKNRELADRIAAKHPEVKIANVLVSNVFLDLPDDGHETLAAQIAAEFDVSMLKNEARWKVPPTA